MHNKQQTAAAQARRDRKNAKLREKRRQLKLAQQQEAAEVEAAAHVLGIVNAVLDVENRDWTEDDKAAAELAATELKAQRIQERRERKNAKLREKRARIRGERLAGQKASDKRISTLVKYLSEIAVSARRLGIDVERYLLDTTYKSARKPRMSLDALAAINAASPQEYQSAAALVIAKRKRHSERCRRYRHSSKSTATGKGPAGRSNRKENEIAEARAAAIAQRVAALIIREFPALQA